MKFMDARQLGTWPIQSLTMMLAALRFLPELVVRHHCASVFRLPMSVDPVLGVPLNT